MAALVAVSVLIDFKTAAHRVGRSVFLELLAAKILSHSQSANSLLTPATERGLVRT